VERQVRFGLGVGALLLGAGYSAVLDDPPLYQDRSFFGVLKVEKRTDWYGEEFSYEVTRLVHGTTLHGEQISVEGFQQYPLTYYHPTGPIGQVFRTYNTDPSRPAAVIGLGTGTMACYALPGQKMTFYDIDYKVKQISYDTDKYFTFVSDARARGANIDLVMGDARLTLKRQQLSDADKYALMVIDAFSSDAIPVHLITSQALEMFLEKLREDGIICFHISNRHLNLHPVLANLATKHGLAGLHMSDGSKGFVGKSGSHWVCLARDAKYMDKLLHQPRWAADDDTLRLLGVIAFPDPNLSGAGSFANLLLGVVDGTAPKEEKEKGVTTWKRIETIEEMERRIPELESRVEILTDQVTKLEKTPLRDIPEAERPKKTAELERRQQQLARNTSNLSKLRKRVITTQKVGVWTDDYSNLLSVFRKDDEEEDD
jgi:hypothetical protein